MTDIVQRTSASEVRPDETRVDRTSAGEVRPDETRVDAVFTALADPTRRHVIATLAGRESATPTALAAELPMTRQAVAKHLGTLSAAGLVHAERVGRETRYALTPEALSEAAAWMAEVGAQWDRRLGRLAALLSGSGSASAPRR